MGRCGRWAALVVAIAGALWPLACSQHHKIAPPVSRAPVVRVRLLSQQNQITLRATMPPMIKSASEPAALKVDVAPNSDVTLELIDNQWRIGNVAIPGEGELTLWPGEDGSVSVNGKAYRGRYRFVPVGMNSFDVVNDVSIDGYLKSVVSKELLHGWNEETYRAQAIVARP